MTHASNARVSHSDLCSEACADRIPDVQQQRSDILKHGTATADRRPGGLRLLVGGGEEVRGRGRLRAEGGAEPRPSGARVPERGHPSGQDVGQLRDLDHGTAELPGAHRTTTTRTLRVQGRDGDEASMFLAQSSDKSMDSC